MSAAASKGKKYRQVSVVSWPARLKPDRQRTEHFLRRATATLEEALTLSISPLPGWNILKPRTTRN